MPAPHLFVVAGEVSGDHQGQLIATALRRLRPDLRISGVGGAEMASAGVNILRETVRWGVIGYVETYVRLPVFALRFWTLVRLIERACPDLLLLIDFPGMNRELAGRFASRIPTVYYFPPQTYGRRGHSASRMARHPVRLLAVLPFEAQAYERAGADVRFVGHPAVDTTAMSPASRGTLRAEWGIAAGPAVGLLPGSRTQEVRSLLPPMLDAARRLHAARGAAFLLPVAAHHLRPAIEAAVASSGVPVRLVNGRALDVMAGSDVVVAASGTALVEAACLGVPVVAVYRLSRLTEWIARRFVVPSDLGRVGFSIPNIVMGRRVVPELLQEDVTGPRISTEVDRLLTDQAAAAAMREDLGEVRRRLGPPGVLERAAGEVLRMLDSRTAGTLR